MVRDILQISLRIAIVNSAFLALRSQSPKTHLHARVSDFASSLALTSTSSILQTSPGGGHAHIPESSISEGGPEDSELLEDEQVVDGAFSVMKNASGLDVSPLPFNLIQVQNRNSSCGPPGATMNVTSLTGPNGSIDWLNCGLSDGSGWRPPLVRVADVSAVNLTHAVVSEESPFRSCGQFLELFEKYGSEFGVPPIFLAAFAMQESSCRAETVGQAGEQGLMQLSKDKCRDSPGGDCLNPEFNIRTAAAYFSDTLKKNKGNLLLTIGEYNGWSAGMTVNQATAVARPHSSSHCCRCQNNLDYLHQFLNGWCQNVNVYARRPPLGKYFNLAKCG